MRPASLQHADPSGLETLELFAHAEHFNRWMYDAIAPWCKGKLLEIGSGIGNISHFFLEKGMSVVLSDLRTDYCKILESRFAGRENLLGVFQLDLSAADPAAGHPELYGRFDTVVALNVVEHIEDDGLAIRNCKKLLRPGGQLVLLIPAYQGLYNHLDIELAHFRRYTKKKINTLLAREGMEPLHTHYFNTVGIFGWWFAGSLQKRKIISTGQLKLYNKLIPLFRLVDKLTGQMAGLSVITVAKNKDPKMISYADL